MNEVSIDLDRIEDLNKLRELDCGTFVLLSGTIYSARDQAHKRLEELLNTHQKIDINFNNKIIYYMGPTPARDNLPIGSCGPTSSYRMDRYLETTLKLGVLATLGKGDRQGSIVDLIKKYKAPYLVTIGGASAVLAQKVISSKVVLFNDLLSEAIMELKVKEFPVVVAIDTTGKQIFR